MLAQRCIDAAVEHTSSVVRQIARGDRSLGMHRFPIVRRRIAGGHPALMPLPGLVRDTEVSADAPARVDSRKGTAPQQFCPFITARTRVRTLAPPFPPPTSDNLRIRGSCGSAASSALTVPELTFAAAIGLPVRNVARSRDRHPTYRLLVCAGSAAA
ncbi:hypothetical protein [Sphingomonas aracearum]|uniref:hypothetical protein n=1 Tax=Sphingomonas aracearum TaxID=2283317 RepID=UPI001C68CAB0|nr:hypothetical protein [Sphingomonas aracearum]